MMILLHILLVLSCAGLVPAFVARTSLGVSRYQHRLSAESSSDDSDSVSPRICVVGGGFGGLNTALALNDLPWPENFKPTITLMDKKERFVFLPLLYELCVDDASIEEVAPTFKSLLEGSDIDFIQCDASGVDISTNT